MRLPYSWPMRWNTRSAPARSTRHATPGYFASNARAIFSATGRSTEVYQASLPSFCAAAISSGVIAAAGGAAAITRVSATPSASAAEPISTSRRESFLPGIAFPVRFLHGSRELDEAGAEIKPHHAAVGTGRLTGALAGRRCPRQRSGPEFGSVERAIHANASTLAFAGIVLGARGSRSWLLLSALATAFLLQHALRGWCPPVPVLRQLGFRTAREIERERQALKALRGDFAEVHAGPEPGTRAQSALSK